MSETKRPKMLKTTFLFFLISTASEIGTANTEVLFLEVKNPDGKTIKLEPDFPYAHVALANDGLIIHSHPKTGVEIISVNDLEKFGVIKEKVSVIFPEGQEALQKWVGAPYDPYFSWDDQGFYCSELVAKILGIAPEPMHFDPVLWPPIYQALEGEMGISPGKIYRKIRVGAFLFRNTLSY